MKQLHAMLLLQRLLTIAGKLQYYDVLSFDARSTRQINLLLLSVDFIEYAFKSEDCIG